MPYNQTVIQVKNLCKRFKLFKSTKDRLFEVFTRRQKHRDFTALDNISFDLPAGVTLGVVGENGSGKSTLLKLIAGILLPDEGIIQRNGKITGLLELGTGFHPEISGRQNIYLNGMYLNMTKKQLEEREQSIIDFAELGEFIDEPLKNYSSGMTMRLAFAVAIHADPQCFIIDEALSVGDVRFQQKCFEHLKSFRKKGGSILFVSHDMNAVKLLCDQAMLLHHGVMRHLGDPDEAINLYNEIMASRGDSGKATDIGYGNAAVRFTSVKVQSPEGNPLSVLTTGDPVDIAFTYVCHKPVDNVTFGVMLKDRLGQEVFGSNGALLKTLANIHADGHAVFHFPAMNVGKGLYTVNMAAHTGTTHLETCYHWWDNAAVFEVLEDNNFRFVGHTRLNVRLELEDSAHAKL